MFHSNLVPLNEVKKATLVKNVEAHWEVDFDTDYHLVEAVLHPKLFKLSNNCKGGEIKFNIDHISGVIVQKSGM